MQESFFMKKIKAIIFDMDGVLIDAKEWHYQSLNRALKLFGLEISRYDHLSTFDGLPTHKKLEILTSNETYKLRFIFSLLKDCGYKDTNSTYKCSFYKPLISKNLIR